MAFGTDKPLGEDKPTARAQLVAVDVTYDDWGPISAIKASSPHWRWEVHKMKRKVDR